RRSGISERRDDRSANSARQRRRLRPAGARGGGVRARVPPARNPIALHVDDVEAARARLEAQGVEFQGETMDSGGCHMAFRTETRACSTTATRRREPGRTAE